MTLAVCEFKKENSGESFVGWVVKLESERNSNFSL